MQTILKHNILFKSAIKAFVVLMALGLIGGIVFLFTNKDNSKPNYKEEDISFDQSLSRRFEIQGFNYNGHYKDKRVLSIKADRVIVEK